MRRIFLAAAIFLFAPFVLASCGGGEASDEDQISDVVAQVEDATGEDELRRVCEDLISQKFLEEVYLGDMDVCIKEPLNKEDELDDPGETKVDSVTVNGSEATARIVTVGGENDGAGGTWALIDESGEWKIDRLEDDYLQSTFTMSVENVGEGLFAYEPMRKCMLNGIDGLDPKKVRRFLYLVVRDDQDAALELGNRIAEEACPSQLAGYVADVLADQVVAEKGAPKSTVECARRQLKPLLLLTGLSTKVLKGAEGSSSATAAAIAGLIAGVAKECPET